MHPISHSLLATYCTTFVPLSIISHSCTREITQNRRPLLNSVGLQLIGNYVQPHAEAKLCETHHMWPENDAINQNESGVLQPSGKLSPK